MSKKLSNNFDENAVLNLVSELNMSGENMLDKIQNTSYNDVLRLRREAAELGIEMTPSEVLDMIEILRVAAS